MGAAYRDHGEPGREIDRHHGRIGERQNDEVIDE